MLTISLFRTADGDYAVWIMFADEVTAVRNQIDIGAARSGRLLF